MSKHTNEEKSFRRSIATEHINRISNLILKGNTRKLKEYGISIEHQRLIYGMDNHFRKSLVQRALRYIKDDYSFCVIEFIDSIRLATKDSEDQSAIDELIKQKAPQDLMYRLHGFHSGDFAQKCKILGISHRKGRKKIPDIQAQIKVQELWEKYSHLPESKRWLEVSRITGIEIGKMYTFFDKETSNFFLLETERRHRG